MNTTQRKRLAGYAVAVSDGRTSHEEARAMLRADILQHDSGSDAAALVDAALADLERTVLRLCEAPTPPPPGPSEGFYANLVLDRLGLLAD